ncbi:hypothetical protein QS257_10920 [Terrilactibacillus sp. S3-3]|nr:hypothetical protein QS257_10920 [Terrilactibacillus sp. S3-3]
MIKLTVMHALNRKLKAQSEQVFEGISKGRKKALDNWFRDKWIQLENTCGMIKSIDENHRLLPKELDSRLKEYDDFCEFLILSDKGNVLKSTCSQHTGLDMSHLPNYQKSLNNEKFMYGPYEIRRHLILIYPAKNLPMKSR